MNYTTIIIVVTIITSYLAFQNPLMMHKWIFNAWHIKRDHQWYRFLTSGFIHNDWGHLAFNMMTLYFLGSGVEQFFRIVYPEKALLLYLSLYIGAIVLSGIPGFLRHKDHPHYNSLGASGGVSALVFCFIIISPTTPLCLFFILCLPGFILGALYIIYTIHMSKAGRDNINHEAHLWGAITGILFLLFINPEIYRLFLESILSFRLSDYF